MAIVIDASVAAAWCLRDDEDTATADAAMARVADERSIVPGIFWHEMRNVLIVAERRGRIESEAAERHLRRLRLLPLVTDHDQDDVETVALSRRHQLSAYDAAYLETAKRRAASIATLDGKLARAAAAEGVATT